MTVSGEKDGRLAPPGGKVIARFFQQGEWLDRFSSLLILCAGILVIALRGAGGGAAAGFALASLLVSAGEKYFAFRVRLDAALFTLLAEHPGGEAGFDEALARLRGGAVAATPGRSFEDRVAGALRLFRWQITAILLQGLLLLAALMGLIISR